MKKFVLVLLLAVLWAIPTLADVSPSLTVEKMVGYEGAWFTADSAPGLSVPLGQAITYRLIVSNTSETETLTGLSLTDSLYPLTDCEVPTELAAGQSFECVVGSIIADTVGTTVNVALATAIDGDGDILTATDSAVVTNTEAEGVIVVIEGVIESIDGQVIVVGGVSYTIPDGNLILSLLEVGDSVVIVAVQAEDGTLTVFLITLADEDIYIDTDNDDDNDDDDDFRDDAPCQARPPDWAPAYGWRMKCDPDSLANFVLPPGQAKKLGRDNDDDGDIDTDDDANPGRGNGRDKKDKKDKKDKGNNGNGRGNGNGNGGNGNGNGKNKK